jgi:type IV pilus assembly protein PilQ
VRFAVIVAAMSSLAGVAGAGDFCAKGTYRGAPVDLDLKDADIQDVFRLLADIGGVNIVVADEVRGKVTLKLKRVAWDQVACTIAAVHKLSLSAKQNVILVRPSSAK